MSDLFENHIVGFPTRRLIYLVLICSIAYMLVLLVNFFHEVFRNCAICPIWSSVVTVMYQLSWFEALTCP